MTATSTSHAPAARVAFDYLRVPGGPEPELTLEPGPAPPGRRVAHVRVADAIVVDLPDDLDGLKARRRAKFWQSFRRRRRRGEEALGPLVDRWLTDPDEIAASLPAVRDVFQRRWAHTYTSLPWGRAEGFAPYADALLAQARRGRAALAVLEADGEIAAFMWLLLEPPWCHVWQHAALREEPYGRYGLGTLLEVRVYERLIADGRFAHLDHMVGDSGAKRAWESWRRPVYRRIEAPDTVAGRLALRARVAVQRGVVRLRDDHPEAYERGKAALRRLERRLRPDD